MKGLDLAQTINNELPTVMCYASQGNLRARTLVAAHKELTLFTKEIDRFFFFFFFPLETIQGLGTLQSQEMKARAVIGKK